MPNTVAPFYQLGQHVAFTVLLGETTEEVSGEVMDTDAAWIAVRDATSDRVQWYNMDYIVRIMVRA